MGFDYFTIRNLAAELSARLAAKTFSRGELIGRELRLEVNGGGILAATLGGKGWLCLLDEAPGYWQQSTEQRHAEPFLGGATVDRVWAESRDRLLWLRLRRVDSQGGPSFGLLVFELIHPAYQAYLVSERSGAVLRCWGGDRQSRLEVGATYLPPGGPPRLLPGVDSVDCFIDACCGVMDPRRALAGGIVGMDGFLASELLASAGIRDKSPIGETGLRDLWQRAEEWYGRPAATGGFLWASRGRTQFSGTPPVSCDAQHLASISEAIRRGCEIGAQTNARPLEDPRPALRPATERLRRRLQALEADLAEAETAALLQRQATIILANLHRIPRGASLVVLPDPYAQGDGTCCVELAPGCPPAEHAARLAKRAERYRRRQQVLPERISEVRTLIGEGVDFLAQPTNSEGIANWLRKTGMQNEIEQRQSSGERAAHPRRYRTSTGWSVWAGRNNTENDVLTHRLAAQNDYWFHAHGYPGSHVVLRRQGRKEEPCPQTLREAAGVAAFWSKGKTAKKVAVVYTLAKFVSKPRGGAPGQALMKREKSIMVEPKLLPEEDDAQQL